MAVGFGGNRPTGSYIEVFDARNGHHLWSSQQPVVVLLGLIGGVVYVTQGQQLNLMNLSTLALRAQDGRQLWKAARVVIAPATAGASSLVVVGNTVYGYGDKLYAFNARQGTLLWQQPKACDGVPGMLVVGSNLLYLATQNRFCAYRQRDGAQIWCTNVKNRGNYFEDFEQVVYMNHKVYVGRGGSNPSGFVIEAREAASGKLDWSWPASAGQLSPDISWPFAGGRGVLYVPSPAGELIAVRASDGKELWRHKLDFGLGLLAAES